MSDVERVEVSRVIECSPAEVFDVVSDPEMHVRIDGSGMLEAAPDSRRATAVGDTFEMAMDREPLGDLPMGKYQVLNTVTRIVPDELFEWNVGSAEHGPFGHVYGWQIRPAGEGRVEVTNYVDWTGVSDRFKEHFPIVPVAMMQKSVDNLAGIMADRASL